MNLCWLCDVAFQKMFIVWQRRRDSSSPFLWWFTGEKLTNQQSTCKKRPVLSRTAESLAPWWLTSKINPVKGWVRCLHGEIKQLFDAVQVRPVGGPSIQPPSRDQKVKRSELETTSSWSACRLRDTWWGSLCCSALLAAALKHSSCPSSSASVLRQWRPNGGRLLHADFVEH